MLEKIPWWVWAGGLAGVAYLIYKFGSKLPNPNTAISAVAQGIANIWLSLPVVGLGSAQSILGNAKLPDGTLVPLNSLVGSIRQDTNTPPNVYAGINGNIYQLAPSDAQGNYPATLLAPLPPLIQGATAGGW
jgi:hypothetical protein